MEVDFFYVHILRIKTMIGQNKLTVKLNITPFEYIKFDRPTAFSRKCVKSNMARVVGPSTSCSNFLKKLLKSCSKSLKVAQKLPQNPKVAQTLLSIF